MITSYVNYLSSRKSDNTVKAYVHDIDGMLSYVHKPETEITINDLDNWVESIHDFSSATQARKISAIKNYFKYLGRMEIITKNPAEYLEPVPIKNKEKFAITGNQVRDMIDCAANYRNKAIIMTYATTGMRVSELINITYDQYANRINDTIIIKGKGEKERKIYFAPETIEMIDKYIRVRNTSTKMTNSPYLFVSSWGNKMDVKNLNSMLKLCAKRAGIENWEDVSNHYLRVAFATMQSEAGTSIEVVQELLGHSNINTTKRYEKISSSRAREAMQSVKF